MKNQIRNSRGITLIALVITIIVLLILAGITIATLTGDNGILTRAAEAKASTEKAEILERARLDILEWEANNKGATITEDALNEILSKYFVVDENEEVVITEKEDEEGNVVKYVTTQKGSYEIALQDIYDGTPVEGETTWEYASDGSITNGKVTLQIGDYIDYNPIPEDYDTDTKPYTDKLNYTSPIGVQHTSGYKPITDITTEGSGYSSTQSFSASQYSGKWRVLGINDNGQILIMSDDNVLVNGTSNYYLAGGTGAKYGTSQLYKISSIFGHGKGATGARSITVEDINKITGYNPNNVGVYDPEQTGSGTKYNSGSTNEYGNIGTYNWGTTEGHITSTFRNGASGVTNNSNYASSYKSNGFNYHDEDMNWFSIASSTSSKIYDLKSTYYDYYPNTLTTSSSGTTVGIETTSNAYDMIFNNSSGSARCYWLASPFVDTSTYCAYFGLRRVLSGYVYSNYLYVSYGYYSYYGGGVSPVVSLESNIKLEPAAGNNSWTIK